MGCVSSRREPQTSPVHTQNLKIDPNEPYLHSKEFIQRPVSVNKACSWVEWVYMALLRVYTALLRVYTALLAVKNALLSGRRAVWGV